MENQVLIPDREPEKWLPHPRKAEGMQFTQSWLREVVMMNNYPGFFVWQLEWQLYKSLSKEHLESMSEVVIPAPIVYIKVVVVKTGIVGF